MFHACRELCLVEIQVGASELANAALLSCAFVVSCSANRGDGVVAVRGAAGSAGPGTPNPSLESIISV